MHRAFRWTIAIGLIVFSLLPLLPQVIWSFAFNWFFPALLPQKWSMRAWEAVVSPGSQVGQAFVTSLLVALAVLAICMLLGMPAARTLALYEFKGKRAIEWLILSPVIVPTLVVAMGIHITFIRYGLADRFAGVVLVHLVPALPYFVLVMAGVFANYSMEFEETARTLGANRWRTFRHVMLPLTFPGLMVASLFTFLVSWSQYITTMLIGGGRVLTLPLVLFPFISAANHSMMATISIIFVLPAILALLLTSRMLNRDAAAVGGLGRL